MESRPPDPKYLTTLKNHLSITTFDSILELKYREHYLGISGKATATLDKIAAGDDHDEVLVVTTCYARIRNKWLYHPLSHYQIEKIDISLQLHRPGDMVRMILDKGWMSNMEADSITVVFTIPMDFPIPKKSGLPFNRFDSLFEDEE